jgi:GNAT superfamily N-acetyltransferase
VITAVKDALQRQQYLRAAMAQDYFRAVMGLRLSLYGETPAAGWQFYTGGRGVCAALAVRGDTAFACGAWETEELAAFLAFLGATHLLAAERLSLPGWRPEKSLSLYVLPAGVQLPLPPCETAFTLLREPPMRTVTHLLWGGAPDADAFYAESCAARNRGWAEYRLALCGGEAVSTVGACAIFGGEAYMAAGETAQGWRGKGIGGRLIVQLANELAARGERVTLLCEAALCPFYARLGFMAAGTYLQMTR